MNITKNDSGAGKWLIYRRKEEAGRFDTNARIICLKTYLLIRIVLRT